MIESERKLFSENRGFEDKMEGQYALAKRNFLRTHPLNQLELEMKIKEQTMNILLGFSRLNSYNLACQGFI